MSTQPQRNCLVVSSEQEFNILHKLRSQAEAAVLSPLQPPAKAECHLGSALGWNPSNSSQGCSGRQWAVVPLQTPSTLTLRSLVPMIPMRTQESQHPHPNEACPWIQRPLLRPVSVLSGRCSERCSAFPSQPISEAARNLES